MNHTKEIPFCSATLDRATAIAGQGGHLNALYSTNTKQIINAKFCLLTELKADCGAEVSESLGQSGASLEESSLTDAGGIGI
ncbi:hypothetical protein [Herbaspirillum huttiense]|uniref:hypothetical protein n=1 Tax=Herbaspirillum huttiense TaxID=863372 RepID=UPI0021769A1B|nr:hypothetical protein [Herbaspirillum huttiense]UWE19302.1 hypothetical protein NY669_21705 [Herbaspirillum huttiense]